MRLAPISLRFRGLVGEKALCLSVLIDRVASKNIRPKSRCP